MTISRKILIFCAFVAGSEKAVWTKSMAPWSNCYKREQSFRVHCLFTGQYYTEDYITLQMLYWQFEDQQVAPPTILISGAKSLLMKALCTVGTISKPDKHNAMFPRILEFEEPLLLKLSKSYINLEKNPNFNNKFVFWEHLMNPRERWWSLEQ